MRSIYPNMIAQQSAFNIYFNNIFPDFYHPPWTSNSWILGLDRHHIRILPSSIFPWGLHGCTWFGSQQEIFPSLGLTAGGDSAHIRAGPGSCAFSLVAFFPMATGWSFCACRQRPRSLAASTRPCRARGVAMASWRRRLA